MDQMRPEKCGGSAAAGGPSGAGESSVAGAEVPGAGAAVRAPDPVNMIDWDAFMKDFDWNFDPSLMQIQAVVPNS